jgi:hypothetical protein
MFFFFVGGGGAEFDRFPVASSPIKGLEVPYLTVHVECKMHTIENPRIITNNMKVDMFIYLNWE